MLPNERDDSTVRALRPDPVQGSTHLRRLFTGVLLVLAALTFGWLILADFQAAESDAAKWEGMLDFGKTLLMFCGAGLAWMLARYFDPRVLGSWVAFVMVLGAGWFVRGFYESGTSDMVTREGFYLGARMLMWTGFGFVVAYAVILFHRRTTRMKESA